VHIADPLSPLWIAVLDIQPIIGRTDYLEYRTRFKHTQRFTPLIRFEQQRRALHRCYRARWAVRGLPVSYGSREQHYGQQQANLDGAPQCWHARATGCGFLAPELTPNVAWPVIFAKALHTKLKHGAHPR
jgi:hypothetical protein